jgi:SAM-dependent methyltransferase
MKLNLGCGHDIQQAEDWINLDIVGLPGVQVVHNLVFMPYPFADNQFEYIACYDVIEHLPPYSPDWKPMIPAFITEMYRILQPGGTLLIRTPGHNAAFGWTDPTHVRLFTKESMDFFDKTSDFGKATGFYSDVDFRVKAHETENGNLEFTMVKT